MLEIELKVSVPSLDPIRDRLLERGAKTSGCLHEHDRYYNAPHRDFAVTDEAVRIRYTNDHAVVTYKGPKIKKFGLKAREELNFAVESGDAFETMLARLGFSLTTNVNKWRETFTLGDATISLDTVEELGTFVEIEVIAEDEAADNPTDRINCLARELGADGEPILSSYLELLVLRRQSKSS